MKLFAFSRCQNFTFWFSQSANHQSYMMLGGLIMWHAYADYARRWSYAASHMYCSMHCVEHTDHAHTCHIHLLSIWFQQRLGFWSHCVFICVAVWVLLPASLHSVERRIFTGTRRATTACACQKVGDVHMTSTYNCRHIVFVDKLRLPYCSLTTVITVEINVTNCVFLPFWMLAFMDSLLFPGQYLPFWTVFQPFFMNWSLECHFQADF